jgi:hypothetical protein
MHRQANLPEIVCALHSPPRFSGSLDGRQEQSDEHSDDCDHHQEFDERECSIATIRLHDSSSNFRQRWAVPARARESAQPKPEEQLVQGAGWPGGLADG